MESKVIRILIIDDHLLVGETIARALSSFPDFDVTAAADIDSAVALIAESGKFDVVLLDYEMPGMDALEGLNRMIEANSGGVALFSGVAKWASVDRTIEAGAAGYIPKTTHLRTLQHAIRMIADGDLYLPADYIRDNRRDEIEQLGLKYHERKVLSFLYRGLTNKEIALELDMDEVNVKMHARGLYRKLGVRNRTQAVMVAQKLGLFE